MSTLFEHPLRRDLPGVIELHDVLIRAYDDEVEALAIAGQVGLLKADIERYPKLRDTWWSILHEAAPWKTSWSDWSASRPQTRASRHTARDCKVVYRELQGPPNYWTRELVDTVFFAIWPPSYFPVHKVFDPDSIMMVPGEAKYVRSGQPPGWNLRLSPLDKQFAAALYPQRTRP